jgi:hypothetical protein
MNRRVLAAGVLIAWLAAVGWLVRKEYWHTSGDPLGEARFSLPPSATYFSLSLGGDQIGYASSTVDTLADTLRVTEVMSLEVAVLGEIRRTDARTEAVLSRSLRLRQFNAWVRGDGPRFAVSGVVEGDSILTVQIESADHQQSVVVRLERPIVLPSLLPLNLAFGGELEVGRSYAVRLFDPLLLNERDVTLTVAAESTFIVSDSAVIDSSRGRFVPIAFDTVHAWRVEQAGGDSPIETWIDDLGQVVRATSPMGFTMERAAFEIAYENFRRSRGEAAVAGNVTASGDVIRQTAIASNVRLDRDTISELRVRLGGLPLDGFDLAGERQELRGDVLVVRRESEEALRPSYRIPSVQPRHRPYLRPEPLIQSEDPRIQALARQIIGNTNRPQRAAERLTDWVYGNLDKRVTLSVPSALEVFDSRRGDCNEHTVLYVALARAVGLPARTAAGLVYLNGAFYYHAWPEVFLNGWVAVDPTFGQFPADAAHIRFTVGGLARQMELIRLIGRLSIDVIDE